jgi:hypothetical protein
MIECGDPLFRGEDGPGFAGGRDIPLVGQVIGHAGEGVDGMDMGPDGGRNEATHGKILVVRLREGGATGIIGLEVHGRNRVGEKAG